MEDSFPKFPALDTSSEQEIVEKRQDDKKGEEDLYEFQKGIQEDSNSLNREMEKDIDNEPLQLDQKNVSVDIEQCTSSGIEEVLEEKRGIKRKRDDDDDDEYEYEMNNKSLHGPQGEGSFWPLHCILTTIFQLPVPKARLS